MKRGGAKAAARIVATRSPMDLPGIQMLSENLSHVGANAAFIAAAVDGPARGQEEASL